MSEWQPIETFPFGVDVLVLEVFSDCYPSIYNEFSILGIPKARNGGTVTHWMPHPPIPPLPKKKHHCTSNCGDWICKTNLNEEGGLILVDYRGVWTPVVACPFCGEPAEKA